MRVNSVAVMCYGERNMKMPTKLPLAGIFDMDSLVYSYLMQISYA